MPILLHQLFLVVLLSIATAKFGWLGCGIATFLLGAYTLAAVRKPGLQLLQLATISCTAYLLWPGFDAAPATAGTWPDWLPWLGYGAGALFVLFVSFSLVVGRGKPAAPAPDCALLPTYLRVPFAEKDAAKRLGAKWDPELRAWYVPANTPLTPFNRWRQGTPAQQAERR